jgi:hypothetical protein
VYYLRTLFVAVATVAVCAWVCTSNSTWISPSLAWAILLCAIFLTAVVCADPPRRVLWIPALVIAWTIVLKIVYTDVLSIPPPEFRLVTQCSHFVRCF